MKKNCFYCKKDITVQNMSRHIKTRLHNLNAKIHEKQ